MALTARRLLLDSFNPLIQSKRFRGKINIQRPKAPHFERAKYIEFTKPYFISPHKGKTALELCKKQTESLKEDTDNPFQNIIAGELRNWFHTSRLVAFYHLNPMNSEEQYKAYVLLKKQNMHYKNFGKKTMELALKDTKFEPVLGFYVSQNMTVFSPDPDIKKLLKITKKFSQLVLLAAVFEGKFVSKDELMELSLVPNLETAQASLVQTLNSVAVTLTSHLNTHQNALVGNLQERMKQLEVEK